MNLKNATNIIFNKNPCVNLRPRYLVMLYIIIALGIIMIPTFIKVTRSNQEFIKYYKAMTDTVITINGCKFDWWSVSHVMLYIVLGFAFPHLWVLLIVISISWELLEHLSSCFERQYIHKPGDPVYWCGKWSDLIVNSFGFIIGLTMRYIITSVSF
jgi:hypothetical protein